MASESEASCLLRSGRIYHQRRGYRDPGGRQVFLGVKRGAFSLYFDDEPIYHFDLDGRWQRLFLDGIHYLKGLDSKVHAIDRVREGENLVLKRRELGHDEAFAVDEHVRSVGEEMARRIGLNLIPLDPPVPIHPIDDIRAFELLESVMRWDALAWAEHRRRFDRTYGAIPFLPPETSSPLIIRSGIRETAGLGFGGGPSANHPAGRETQVAVHAGDVAVLLGRRVTQCRQIFLAGDDAIRRPTSKLLEDMDSVASVFPIGDTHDVTPDHARPDQPIRLEGFHAAIHEFDHPPFEPAEWDAVRSAGMTRVILCLESGSTHVRSIYRRDWTSAGFVDWARACSVGIGIVVLVGAGGETASVEHVEATATLVGSLPLPPGTIVSLVDADEIDLRTAEERGFEHLRPAEMSRQRHEIKTRLAAALGPRRVKVTSYSPAKRWQ